MIFDKLDLIMMSLMSQGYQQEEIAGFMDVSQSAISQRRIKIRRMTGAERAMKNCDEYNG